MDNNNDQLQLAGIPLLNLRKGEQFTLEQVLHTCYQMDPKLASNIERYETGELASDPLTFLPLQLVKRIEKETLEAGRPVVCKIHQGGIRILTDSEASKYLDSQANAGLRKHRAKTQQLFTSVDSSKLTDHERQELVARQNKQAFVLAAHQGARTQSLRMQRKGLTLPKYGEIPSGS